MTFAQSILCLSCVCLMSLCYLEVLALLDASSSVCGCSFGFGFRGLFSPGSLKSDHRMESGMEMEMENQYNKSSHSDTTHPVFGSTGVKSRNNCVELKKTTDTYKC